MWEALLPLLLFVLPFRLWLHHDTPFWPASFPQRNILIALWSPLVTDSFVSLTASVILSFTFAITIMTDLRWVCLGSSCLRPYVLPVPAYIFFLSQVFNHGFLKSSFPTLFSLFSFWNSHYRNVGMLNGILELFKPPHFFFLSAILVRGNIYLSSRAFMCSVSLSLIIISSNVFYFSYWVLYFWLSLSYIF